MWWGPTLVAQPDPRARAGMRRERDEEDGEPHDTTGRRQKRAAPAPDTPAAQETPARGEGGSRKRKDVSATGFDLGAQGWLPSETLLDHAASESLSPEAAPAHKRLLMIGTRQAFMANGGGGGASGAGHGDADAPAAAGAAAADAPAADAAATGNDDDDDDDGNAMSWEGTGHFARVENEHDSLLLHDNPYSQPNFLLRTLTLDRLGRERRRDHK